MAKFTLFCRLPPEIRDEIWQLCLPRRILELDNPVLHDDKTCWTGYATWHNGRPPALTRVCREARCVAQMHGKFGRLPLRPMPFEVISNSFWHQIYLDSVHLNLLSDDEEPPYEGKTPCTPLSDALVRCWNMATSLSFTRKLFHCITVPRYQDWSPAFDRVALTTRTGETFRVVFSIITIHLTAAQVTSSGLFGHLGDEIVKLVDIDAFDVVERYRRLFCASKRQPEYVQSLFNALAPSSAWREPLPKWPQTVQTLLLAAACKAWDAADQDPDLDTFWMQVGREDLPDGYLEPRFFAGLEDLHEDIFAGRLVPNYNNALVQRLTAEFPTFRPSVMFRACTYDRCEEMVAKIGMSKTFPMTTSYDHGNTDNQYFSRMKRSE